MNKNVIVRTVNQTNVSFTVSTLLINNQIGVATEKHVHFHEHGYLIDQLIGLGSIELTLKIHFSRF